MSTTFYLVDPTDLKKFISLSRNLINYAEELQEKLVKITTDEVSPEHISYAILKMLNGLAINHPGHPDNHISLARRISTGDGKTKTTLYINLNYLEHQTTKQIIDEYGKIYTLEEFTTSADEFTLEPRQNSLEQTPKDFRN